MKRPNLRMTGLFVAALAFIAATQPLNATITVTFGLDSVFNGDTPKSSSPWLTAVFKDTGNGSVQLTLTSSLNDSKEYIDQVAFNVKSTITPSQISVVNTTPGNPIVTSFSASTQNAQNLNGGGDLGKGFDFLVNWETANNNGGVKRFNGTDVEAFTFVFTGLTEKDFEYQNTGGAAAYVAAHIQGDGASSAVKATSFTEGTPTTVPEPATLVAGALLLLPFGAGTLRVLRTKRAV